MNVSLRPSTQNVLQAFQNRRKRLLIWRFFFTLLCVALLAFVVIALLDRVRWMPEAVRPYLSLGVYAGAIWMAWRTAGRYMAQSKSLLGAAHLLEAGVPSLRESVVAAVELSAGIGHEHESAEFREKLQDDVAQRLSLVKLAEALPLRSLSYWGLRAALVCLITLGLSFIPKLHLPGFLARACLPFANLPRPSLFQVRVLAPTPANALVPISSQTEVKAEVTGAVPEQVQIELESGQTRSMQSMELIAPTRYQALVSVEQNDVRYRILAEDAMSPWFTLSARPRPRVQEFVKTIVAPAYAGLPDHVLREDQGDIEALEGSVIRLELKANQPIREASLHLNPDHADAPPATPAQSVQNDIVKAEFAVKPEIEAWHVALTAAETGFTNEESTSWRVTAIPDLPPVVQILDPIEQVELLPDETLRLRGQASDDVGLAKVLLSYQINAGKAVEKEVFGKAGREADVQTLLALPTLQVKAGDTLMLKLIAVDLKQQSVESAPLRVVILEQTVSPQQKEWAAQGRRFAQQAETLAEEARELRKAVENLRKTERAAKTKNEAQQAALDAVARAQMEVEKVSSGAEDLWKALQETARQAPSRLDASEALLLGERLAHLREAALKPLSEKLKQDIQQPENLRRHASDIQADIDAVMSAARAFAAEDNARIVAKQAQQLARQEALLTEQALPANRDAAQRPKWQEQQRGALAAMQPLIEQMEDLKPLVDGGQQNQLKDAQKLINETSADLEASLDKADQAKSPEHLYGAADNLRQRLSRSADAARSMAEQAANRSAQLREQIARQENPAFVALNEAREALQQAVQEAKKSNAKQKLDREGRTAQEKAQQELATAARQMQEQASLREQNALTNDESTLDTNRASRALDQMAHEALSATAPEATLAKAEKLREAIKTLETQEQIQTALQANSEAASQASLLDEGMAAQEAKAAQEALKQVPEALRRQRTPELQALAQKAQQAADTSRAAAEQFEQLSRQAATAAPNQDIRVEPAAQAAQQAQDQIQDLVEQFAAQTDLARTDLAQLTPKVSEMMKSVAQDLQKNQQQTQAAATQAEEKKPLAEVAEKAEALQENAADNSERMSALQAALRQEANAADLQNQSQRQLSRTADAALAQMQQTQPAVEQNFKQAAAAQASQEQAQALNQAAEAQKQAAKTLENLAKNMAKAEAGEELSQEELAQASQMEQDLGVKEPLDEAYARAQALAQMAQDATQDPSKVLSALEKELPKNPAMQKALADIGKETAKASEQAVAVEAQQPSNLGLATEQAANDLQRVARHQERLGQKEAASQTATAAESLQKQAQAAKTTPTPPGKPSPPAAKPVGEEAVAPASLAAKSAEATSLATPPAMTLHPLQTVQAQLLASALDQLDSQLHPIQGNQEAQQGQSQQTQEAQSGQQKSQQSSQAQKSLSQAQQAQQQQMADQRNQGQTPGSQPPNASQMAQNSNKPSQPNANSSNPQSNEGGDLQALMKDGVLGAEMVLISGDWGHLPSKMAEDLTEATRSEAAPEYRAAIENYYKAIATKSKK